jgi:hypothetical protein
VTDLVEKELADGHSASKYNAAREMTCSLAERLPAEDEEDRSLALHLLNQFRARGER